MAHLGQKCPKITDFVDFNIVSCWFHRYSTLILFCSLRVSSYHDTTPINPRCPTPHGGLSKFSRLPVHIHTHHGHTLYTHVVVTLSCGNVIIGGQAVLLSSNPVGKLGETASAQPCSAFPTNPIGIVAASRAMPSAPTCVCLRMLTEPIRETKQGHAIPEHLFGCFTHE